LGRKGKGGWEEREEAEEGREIRGQAGRGEKWDGTHPSLDRNQRPRL